MLAAGGITMIFPFIWMVSTSLKSPLEVLSSQLALIPAVKKYIAFEGRLEQVEFLVDRRLQDEVSAFQGEITRSIGSFADISLEAEKRLTTFFANSLGEARESIGTFFNKYRSRPEITAELDRIIARLDSAFLSLAPEEKIPVVLRDEIRGKLAELGDRFRKILLASGYGREDIEVVIVGRAEGGGEVTTISADDLHYKRFLWRNFKDAWEAAPFARYFFNSIFIATAVTIGQVITSALAAYAFARMEFKFKETLFMVLLGTMMIPKQVILIPDYAIISTLGWINTYYALIVPFVAAVFGIYFMRQHFETLPQDLFDAASIDGCGRLRTLFQVVLPISKSVIITVALFTFIMFWNSLLWPLVMTNTPEMRPLQVGLAVFNQESGTDWELLMSASTFSILPLLLLFFIAQKQFIEGVTRSGMKD